MTDRGWGLSEQHLMPDAVVAFVDGELSPTAWDRASAHIAKCPYCAAEVAAQRQARAAVKEADTPAPSAWLSASLRAIPDKVEMPSAAAPRSSSPATSTRRRWTRSSARRA